MGGSPKVRWCEALAKSRPQLAKLLKQMRMLWSWGPDPIGGTADFTDWYRDAHQVELASLVELGPRFYRGNPSGMNAGKRHTRWY